MAVLDHLIYAVPDLDAAVEEIARSLGVRPAGGGRHEGWGTHNAVLGLGDGAYVELLAPDPSQPTPPRPRLAGLDDLAEPRLVAWAARSDDIEASLERARAAGFDPGPATGDEPDPARRRGADVATDATAIRGARGGAVPHRLGRQPAPLDRRARRCAARSLRDRAPRPRAHARQPRGIGLGPSGDSGTAGDAPRHLAVRQRRRRARLERGAARPRQGGSSSGRTLRRRLWCPQRSWPLSMLVGPPAA